MPSGTVLDVLAPPMTPKAHALLMEYRSAVPRGEMMNVGTPKAVRINATEIAQRLHSAWVIACHMRAAIDGLRGDDVVKPGFDINRYTIPSDLGTKKATKR